MRRTKVVATIGPASESSAVLARMVAAGMDVARLNASHADIPGLRRMLSAVREASREAKRHVGVMVDLPGPKIRVGEMSAGVVLEVGQTFALASAPCIGDSSRACVTHPRLAEDVSPGDRVLLDDGRIELVVEQAAGGEVRTRVVVGGPLDSHEGVNVPGVSLSVDALTDRDRDVCAWALDAGVDIIAQSFVRDAGDVRRLRQLVGDSSVSLVAKIEKHEATADIEGIVEAADAVMVARGDLGVETAAEEVPVLQRRIVSAARQAGRPVIIATQMLESMVKAPRPTRAEASDVAGAIFERADAVMLSAETAVGAYPVDSVETMARIAERAESAIAARPHDRLPGGGWNVVTRAVSAAVCEIAEDVGAAAILTATQSGATARAVARHRPPIPIIAMTPSEEVARRLALVWGVQAVVAPLAPAEDRTLHSLAAAAREAGLLRPGDRIAVTAGVARGMPGGTDLVLVREVPGD